MTFEGVPELEYSGKHATVTVKADDGSEIQFEVDEWSMKITYDYAVQRWGENPHAYMPTYKYGRRLTVSGDLGITEYKTAVDPALAEDIDA